MSGAQTSTFAPVNAMFPAFEGQSLSNQAQQIANQYAPQRNQLFLDTGNEALNFARQKDPLEITSLRQQLGLDPNPVLDRLTKLYSDNNPPPAAPGSGSGTAATGGGIGAGGDIEAPALARAQAVRDGLIARGMNPDGATAFAANALHESVANPNTGPGDMGASHGLFQWNGDRLAAFQRANGGLLPEQTSLDKQLDFVVSELNGPESVAKDRIMQAQGVDGKAAQVSEAYLRPKDTVPEMQRRSATGLKLAGLWAGQGGQPGGGAPGAAQPQLGTPGGGQPTAGMTDAQWLAEAQKSYPGLGGPNDSSQQPNAGAPAPSIQATRLGGTATAGPAAGPSQGVPQPPPNNILPGSPNGPAVPPAATAPPAATQPQPGLPPSGTNSPQVQEAQRLLRQATMIELAAAQSPNDPRVKASAAAMAADLKQRAQVLMQTDSVVQLPDGRQYHPLTGKMDDPAKRLSTWVLNPNAGGPGIAGYTDTTGNEKPEIVPAQRADAEAQQLVMTLGPKVANGTATPQEQASYAIAAETYRKPAVVTDPITKAPTRVYERALPAGFPDPSGAGAGGQGTPGGPSGQPLTQGVSPQQQDIERDPAAAKVADQRYERDAKNIDELTAGVRQSQNDNLRVQEMRNVLNAINTGPGSEAQNAVRAWFARWNPAGAADYDKQAANLTGPAAAEAFQKLAFKGSISQEQGSSPRGGYAVTKLFQQLNPGLDLLNPANKNLLDMQLITNQANIDYNQGATDHFNTQEDRYQNTHKYDSLNVYDQTWNKQRNPQVYAAAMGAVAGQQPEQWAKGLSDSEYARALQIISRADPAAVINTKSGRYAMQPKVTSTGGTPAAPGDRVLKFDHSGNPIPQ
jgi:hypothetical protein